MVFSNFSIEYLLYFLYCNDKKANDNGGMMKENKYYMITNFLVKS